MVIDTTKTPAENLIELINTTERASNSNYVDLTSADITLAVPATGTVDGFNTQVEVDAINGSHYTGNTTINYNRITPIQGVSNPQTTYTTAGDMTLDQLKTEICTALSLIEAEFTLTGDLPANSGDQTTLTLTANAGSYLYIDSAAIVVTNAS